MWGGFVDPDPPPPPSELILLISRDIESFQEYEHGSSGKISSLTTHKSCITLAEQIIDCDAKVENRQKACNI
jgi:hypothetical protein